MENRDLLIKHLDIRQNMGYNNSTLILLGIFWLYIRPAYNSLNKKNMYLKFTYYYVLLVINIIWIYLVTQLHKSSPHKSNGKNLVHWKKKSSRILHVDVAGFPVGNKYDNIPRYNVLCINNFSVCIYFKTHKL